jgi:hypothetical protein
MGEVVYARSYPQVYLLRGALLFLVALPVLLVNRSPGGTFGFLDGIGVAFGCLGSVSNRWGMRNWRGSQKIYTIGGRYCEAGCGGTRHTPTISERSCNSGVFG